MPEDLPEEASRDLLAYPSFRIAPPPGAEDGRTEDRIFWELINGVDNRHTPIAFKLEQRFVERLVPIVGIPLEVKVFPRKGSIELAMLILGAYALLKDYKPLRDSIDLLVQDIKNVLEEESPGGFPPGWTVEVADSRIPGTIVPETFGGFVRMGLISRYALVYLLIITFLVLIFFCYLTLTAVIANT